jgi:hypothetical protein
MSADRGKADIPPTGCHFRFWAHKADIAVASVDLISIRPLKPRVGVVKSLEVICCGPVVLIHPQNF